MRTLECAIERKDGVTVFRPAGRIDSGVTDHFEKLMNDEVRKTTHSVVLDMSEVTFIASSTLRVMLTTTRRLRARKSRFVVSGALPHITGIMNTAGFDRMLRIRSELSEAIAEAAGPAAQAAAASAPAPADALAAEAAAPAAAAWAPAPAPAVPGGGAAAPAGGPRPGTGQQAETPGEAPVPWGRRALGWLLRGTLRVLSGRRQRPAQH